MKTPRNANPSPALTFISACWDAIPRRSWRNRNHAMRTAVVTAIESGMPFDPGDFQQISADYNMSYWCSGGEGFYQQACAAKSGANLSAAIALEQWFDRPAWLWPERTRTPERLYIGATFTWKDHLVTVTSFDKDGQTLTACTYKDDDGCRRGREEYAIGDVAWVCGDKRRIEALNRTPEDVLMLRLSAPCPDESRTIDRRFTVRFDELAAIRKAFDSKRRSYEQRLAAAPNLAELEAISRDYSREPREAFRHFDHEILRELYPKAERRIRESLSRVEQEEQQRRLDASHDSDLAAWIAGGRATRCFTGRVRLRVHEGWVETSYGDRATVASVRTALAFIRKHRRQGWHANGTTLDIDQYPLEEISAEGVKVGCTRIDWSEVDRIADQLLEA